MLNIELKSEEVEFEKIKRQLTKNRYYLQYLNRNMRLFTFIAATGDVFALNESGELEYSDITTVSSAIKALTGNREIDVQGLFRVSNYLISPLNTPERFLCEQYFLTKQQEEFKNAIMSFFKRETPCFCAISGEAGTGKTLLLYDIVRECGKLGHCCVIHCGNLSQGHLYLNEKLLDVDIIAAKDLRNGYDFDIYEYVFVDEAQRIYQNSFELIVDAVQKGGKKCVWSYDSKQTLSLKEQNSNIQAKIELLSGIHKCYLTGKIRTNKEMAYFLRSLWDLNEARDEGQHPNVTVVYANTIKEVEEYLTYYAQKGYTFINFTPSVNVNEFLSHTPANF